MRYLRHMQYHASHKHLVKAAKHQTTQRWLRWIHINFSMGMLIVLALFAFTGITLNHPHWFGPETPAKQLQQLALPERFLSQKQQRFELQEQALISWLRQQDIKGIASSPELYIEQQDGQLSIAEASMDFKGPGYNASVFIDLLAGEAEIETTDYGWVAQLNDLHKGRNTGDAWIVFIDISALLTLLLAISGACLLLPRTKRLKQALQWTTAGTLLSLMTYFIFVL